jgi:hypothetical protein
MKTTEYGIDIVNDDGVGEENFDRFTNGRLLLSEIEKEVPEKYTGSDRLIRLISKTGLAIANCDSVALKENLIFTQMVAVSEYAD